MMRRLLVIGTVGALIVGAFPPATLGGNPTAADRFGRFERIDVREAKPMLDVLRRNQEKQVDVIVTLGGKPLAVRLADVKAQGKNLSKDERAAIVRDLKAAQAPLIARAKALGAKVRETFQASYSGFSVRIAKGKVAQLSALPGVTSVTAVRKVEHDLERSVPLIGAPAAWQDYGFTGAGVKVGIIDTGVDYYHANFGGSGDPDDFANADGHGTDGVFPTAKVAGGYDFVGDDYDANTPVPDPDPLDCNGHGSHVAGIAAGFGVLSNGSTYSGTYGSATIGGNSWNVGPGVAPQATLYAYRVFGCDGSASDDVIIAAIDRAVLDGVDVINMSLGAPFGTATDPTAIASDNASAAGVMVVTSAGNSGPSAYITGSPGTSTRAMSTAAFDGGFAGFPTATIDITGVGTMANNNSGGPLPVTTGVVVLPDGSGGISLGCNNSEYSGVAGKIVVAKRGTCDRVARAIFGQNNGAVAVILVNNGGGLPPFEGPIGGVTIPFLGAAGGTDAAFLGANGTTHTITPGPVTPSPSYLHLADFTSGGPRYDDSAAKPDVTAPGVSVFSTNVGSGTGAIAISGTSMASPHSAGVAALVVDAHPSWTPGQIKAAIMNTASVDASLLASPADRNVRLAGAGVVQPRKAVDTKLYATTGVGTASLSFNAPASGNSWSANRPITIWNTGGSSVKLNLSNSFQNALGATASFNKSSVTVPAGGSASVTFKLALTKAAVAALPDAEVSTSGELTTIRGAVTATPAAGGPGLYALRIPYLVAPRGTSDIKPTPDTLKFGTASSKDVKLKNKDVHSGNADFYAWGNSSPNSGLGPVDLHADGVQALPGPFLGGDSSDRSLVFAVNMYGQWSNPSGVEVDIAVDTDLDNAPDYFVIGFDLGAILTGDFDGRYAAFIVDNSFNIIDAWIADAPMNSGTMLLPALATADLGISAGTPIFQYNAAAFSVLGNDADFDTTWAKFNAYTQPVSTGDFVTVAPGATVNNSLSINRASLITAPQNGWIVVTMDDESGEGQADLVTLRYAP
jgi:minor extracellular serine protease Vpr